tara:strand:- start:7791 stop:8450 length:660 start_codon:yes stop_codon:yes gene_type:complete
MATSQYFLNRYQRTLANKPRLLQQRIAIESDISKKKYDADIKMLEKQIGFAEGAVGMGIDYYDYKKGAESEASLGDFLGDRIEQSLGIGSEDSEVNKTIGTQREERIASRKAERKELGQGMFGGYVDNLKGFLTRPLTNPATNETLGRFMPTGSNVNPAYGRFYQSSTDQQRNILRQQQINNILNASNTEPVAMINNLPVNQNQVDEAMANAAMRLGRN